MQQEFMYRRVSTDSLDSHTLEQQETQCRNACEANGLIIVDVFRETGNSEPGTSPAEHREEK
jgi:DNA invertase Pin-like site-specific DNA recombinase